MKTYLFHNPEDVTQQQFEQEMLPLLPQWRREQALRYKFLMGRVQCAAAFILLKNGLKNDFGIDEEIEFDYVANEKPVLRHHPDIHFNLSHCKKGVLCVIDETRPGLPPECAPGHILPLRAQQDRRGGGYGASFERCGRDNPFPGRSGL